MRRAASSKRLRLPVVPAFAAAAIFFAHPLAPVHAQDEVRALWVARTSLTSRADVATMVNAARASGFNTLLVQIRARGDSYFANGLEPRPSALVGEPAFDPLAATIAGARDAGLQVHAWINVNLVAGANELPSARDHVIYRHPEWLMVPRALAEDLLSVEPRSPEYLGRLTRYVRSQPSEVEGLYLSPIEDQAADHTVAVVRDIVSRYAVDGVHLDYVRYPNDEFDYSGGALTAFRRAVFGDLPAADLRGYDARLAGEPLIYTRAFPDRWRAFRAGRMTTLMSRLRDTVRAEKPSAIVSAAVSPDADEAASRRLQDWRTWLDRGIVDVICPMAYTADGTLFTSQIAAVHAMAGRHPVWAGIGAYRLSSEQIVENVRTARRLGAGGIVLFSYDSLTGPARGSDYLANVGRAAFMQ